MSSELDDDYANKEQHLSLDEKAQTEAESAGDDVDYVNTHVLRVLAVDDSVVCLKILVALLRQCKYNVTETTNPVEALQVLRTRKHEFDIVITDLRMLEMDGLVLLQKISLEMDLPVVMLSADDNQDNIMKAIRYGARDYLIKPPRMAQIQNVWQHVVRKRLFGTNCNNNINKSSITKEDEEEEEETPSPPKLVDDSKTELDETVVRVQKRKGEAEISDSCKKKRRVSWTVDLHNKFTDAIEKIGIKAVPMEILKVMNVPGLTRANVASHLQKFKNAIRSQAQSEPHDSNNVNYAAGRNGYQTSSCSMGMMIQAIGTNPHLPQKLSYNPNNQNSRIFQQGTNKHQMSFGEHYNNLPMNQPAYLAPTMLNNAPLPPRKVLTNQQPSPSRLDRVMFSTIGNNMKIGYPSSQHFTDFHTPPTYLSAFAGKMAAATSSAYSRQNGMLCNGQNYQETENMYPQLNCAAASDYPDTHTNNYITKTSSSFNVDPFQTSQSETWSMNNNNNSIVNPVLMETSNLSNRNNGNVEVQNFHSSTHEELPIDTRFELSNEDDNDELNSMVMSFHFEVPPSL